MSGVERKQRAYPDALVELNFLLVSVVVIEGIHANVVVEEFSTNLRGQSEQTNVSEAPITDVHRVHTLCLNDSRSSKVKLSALAMIGTMLTTSLSFFMTITSMARREWPVGLMKYRQQWIRVSWM